MHAIIQHVQFLRVLQRGDDERGIVFVVAYVEYAAHLEVRGQFDLFVLLVLILSQLLDPLGGIDQEPVPDLEAHVVGEIRSYQ